MSLKQIEPMSVVTYWNINWEQLH